MYDSYMILHVHSVSLGLFSDLCVWVVDLSETGILFPGELRFTLGWISVPLGNKMVADMCLVE